MTDNEQNLLAAGLELADYVRTLEITDARLTKMLAEIDTLRAEVNAENDPDDIFPVQTTVTISTRPSFNADGSPGATRTEPPLNLPPAPTPAELEAKYLREYYREYPDQDPHRIHDCRQELNR